MICCAIVTLFLVFNYVNFTKHKKGCIGCGTEPTTKAPKKRPIKNNKGE